MNPKMAMAAAQTAQLGIRAVVEMYKVHESEETQRHFVTTHYATLVELFRQEQAKILRYYEMKFAERRASLEEFYELLHQAVETGNDFHLQSALFGILDIIKTDPLADYDQFVRAYQDPDVKLEI